MVWQVRVLLDTHTLLWWLGEQSSLSLKAYAILDDTENEILVSAVSAFELSLKYHLGKLPESAQLMNDCEACITKMQASQINITPLHALRAGQYQSEHRDPFDLLLVAQAELEGVALVSKDAQLQGFPIQILW